MKLFLETGRPAGTVNLCAESKATHRLVVKCLNHVGVLADILDRLREEGVNVENIENTVFAGAKVACTSLLLDRGPSSRLVDSLRGSENVLSVTAAACK